MRRKFATVEKERNGVFAKRETFLMIQTASPPKPSNTLFNK